ncbi:hypothetical protein AAC387_Pa07g3058 [Persea americana]
MRLPLCGRPLSQPRASRGAKGPEEPAWKGICLESDPPNLTYRGIFDIIEVRILNFGKVLELCSYSDTDLAGDLDKKKFIIGCVFTFGGGAVSSDSKKQTSTAMSTAEAEYIAYSTTVEEILWLKYFLTDLEIIREKEYVPMNVDSTFAISMVNEQKFNCRSKHVEIKYHFIKEKAEKNDIKFFYMPSKELMADALTKALPVEVFARHVLRMRLRYI